MCGLVGALSSHLSLNELSVFRDLCKMAILRGEEGSGVVAINADTKEKPFLVHSQASLAELVNGPGYAKIFADKATVSCLAGHARYPTKGSSSLADMHPFSVNQIIGMHNGTFDEILGEKVEDTVSDSKLLFQKFATNGVANTMKESVGAYSLVWIDRVLDTVNFLRNWERTLYFGKWKTVPGTMFWASERMMLEWAMHRRRPSADIQIWALPVDKWVTFRLHPFSAINVVNSVEVRSKPKPRKMTDDLPDDYIPFDGSPGGGGTVVPFPQAQLNIDPITRLPAIGVDSVYPPPTFNRSISPGGDEPSWVTTPGSFLTFEDLRHLLVKGCAACLQPVKLQEYTNHLLKWFRPNEFLCFDCYTNSETDRQYADAELARYMAERSLQERMSKHV